MSRLHRGGVGQNHRISVLPQSIDQPVPVERRFDGHHLELLAEGLQRVPDQRQLVRQALGQQLLVPPVGDNIQRVVGRKGDATEERLTQVRAPFLAPQRFVCRRPTGSLLVPQCNAVPGKEPYMSTHLHISQTALGAFFLRIGENRGNLRIELFLLGSEQVAPSHPIRVTRDRAVSR
jgi:hypothetical protein